MKRYSKLTEAEKQHLKDIGELNGCGGKGGWFNPPNFFWLADCDHHDYKFLVGGCLKEYFIANWQFFVAMIYDVNNKAIKTVWPFSQVIFAIFFLIAFNYFIAVNLFGWKFFNWKCK